jgi:hypothetical protein
VDTEAGNNEEQEDAYVTKGTGELQKLNGPAKDVAGEGIAGLPGSVVEDHTQRRDSSQRINTL